MVSLYVARMDAFETSDARRIRRRLLEFYDARRRELPWRGEEDPYRVWVSEVMLQQTRVETVVPYYRRWMERFPTLEALASAERAEVLQLWQGLGYYRRARNLHRAAGVVRERFDGEVPGTVEELKELPGVGPYTAGAVASIAFDVPAPAVDGNVRRVLSRLFDLPDPTAGELRKRAGALVDPERPGDLNQALMELGATVCSPSSPECGHCPLGDLCLARARGTVGERPPSRSRGPVPERVAAVAVLVDGGGRTLVRRRPEDGLLGGMWEFPAEELDGDGDDPEDGEALGRALRAAGVDGAVGSCRPLEPVKHAFTHLKMLYRPYLVSAEALAEGAAPDGNAGDEGEGGGGAGTVAGGSDREAGREPVEGRDAPARGGVRVLPLDGLDAVPLPVAQQEIARRARRALAEGGDLPPE